MTSLDADDRGDAAGQVERIVARFDGKPDDWKLRMRSLVQVARLGAGAVPPLVEAFRGGTPGEREFAVQALAMFDNASLRTDLERALEDAASPVAVRIYAVRALRMLGELEPAERYRDYVFDPERGVRGTMSGALEWQGEIRAEDVRRQLAEYDLTHLDSARPGQLAPDFVLPSFSGETVRLSDLRGQSVVLRYFKLDY